MKDLTDIWDASARRAQETFDAIQDELSGNGLSRQAKLGDHREEVSERRGASRKGRSTIDTALDLVLSRRAYEELYQATWDTLRSAELEAADAILQLETALTKETDHLETLYESAATLPDGTKVFSAADGTIRSADGLDATHLATHIEWAGMNPVGSN
ncbi:MAG: hypothetical protein AAGF20_02820 [Pseudomonadota bacterium]